MGLNELPFNWFDIVLVLVLFIGISRGRKRGMSEELLSLIAWLGVALGCALIYEPLGQLISQIAVMGLLWGYVLAYIAGALMIGCFFLVLKRSVGGKLLGSDVFGKSEFYLGMLAGMLRFACILLACLALLNARFYSQAEVQANVKYQNDVYGSTFFPTLYEVQAQVFETSMTGPWIRNQLGFLLIKPTAPEGKKFRQKEFAIP